jgi:tetratricopeptide (TPR) repeat protein
MTNRRRLSATLIILLVTFFTPSCATNNLQLHKEQGESIRNIGEVYMQQGDDRKALKEFQRSQALYTDDHLLHYDFGIVYFNLNRLDLSVTHFKKALGLKPDFAAAKNNLGIAYFRQKKLDKAIETFNELGGDLLYATPYYPLSNLGEVYFEKKEYRLAEKNFKAALEIEPLFAKALRGLGKTYMAEGRIPEAVQIFEKAVKNAPTFAALYLDLGKAYTLAREYKKALSAYNRVIELAAPDSDLAKKAGQEADRIR